MMNKIYLNRRVLAELAVIDSIGFKEIIKVIKIKILNISMKK